MMKHLLYKLRSRPFFVFNQKWNTVTSLTCNHLSRQCLLVLCAECYRVVFGSCRSGACGAWCVPEPCHPAAGSGRCYITTHLIPGSWGPGPPLPARPPAPCQGPLYTCPRPWGRTSVLCNDGPQAPPNEGSPGMTFTNLMKWPTRESIKPTPSYIVSASL